MEKLPECPQYLLHSRSFMYRKKSEFEHYQQVIEAILTSHLHLRAGRPAHDAGNVIMFTMKTLDAFYDLKYADEYKMVYPLFKEWYKKAEMPLDGMYFMPEAEETMYNLGNKCQENMLERMCTCFFMSDIFCRILRQKEKTFPRQYTFLWTRETNVFVWLINSWNWTVSFVDKKRGHTEKNLAYF